MPKKITIFKRKKHTAPKRKKKIKGHLNQTRYRAVHSKPPKVQIDLEKEKTLDQPAEMSWRKEGSWVFSAK